MRAKIIISAIATLWAAAATAAPVNVQTNLWNFSVSTYTGGYPGGGGQDSCYFCYHNNSQYTLEDEIGPSGEVYASATATMSTTLSEDDNTLSLLGFATSEAFASVAEVSEGTATGSAMAGASLRVWLTQFEVLEPVLYTGTQPIFGGSVNPNGNYGPQFLSGSILQPGIYSNAIRGTGSYSSVSVRGAGEDYAQASQSFELTFTRVPEPGSLALMLLGVAGIAASRRKAAKSVQ